MLNTDAHSSQIKHKMTKAEFTRNNRGARRTLSRTLTRTLTLTSKQPPASSPNPNPNPNPNQQAAARKQP